MEMMIKRLSILFLGIIWVLNSGLATRAQGNPMITPENAAQLTQLALWGRGTIHDLDWSPDGTILAVSGSLGAWMYDTQEWQAEPRLIAPAEKIREAAFSPDAQTLAIVGENEKVTVWDALTGEKIRTLGERFPVYNAAFSPDGSLLALAIKNGGVRLWDTSTWEILADLRGHKDHMLSVAFSPDSTKLAAGDNKGLIWVWDVPTRQQYAILEGHTNQVWSVVFSPDGREIASWSNDYSVRFWDVESRQQSTEFELYERVAYSPTGAQIAMGYPGGFIRLWEDGSEQELTIFQQDRWSSVTRLGFSPDGTQLAVANQSGALKIWDVERNEETALLSGFMSEVGSVRFSSDGSLLALGDYQDNIRLWDPQSGAERTVIWRRGAGSIQISSDNALLAATNGFAIRVWSLDDNTLLREFEINGTGSIYASALSPDGTQVAGAGVKLSWDDPAESFVQIWDIARGRSVRRVSLPGDDPDSIAFSPDGTLVACGNMTGDAYLIDVEMRKIVQEWHTGFGPVTVNFSPDGQRLVAAGTMSCSSQVHTVFEEALPLELNTCGPLYWSPNGELLAAVEVGGMVSLWDATTGEKLFFSSDYSDANGLAFDPDGSRLLTAGQDGTVRVWGIP